MAALMLWIIVLYLRRFIRFLCLPCVLIPICVSSSYASLTSLYRLPTWTWILSFPFRFRSTLKHRRTEENWPEMTDLMKMSWNAINCVMGYVISGRVVFVSSLASRVAKRSRKQNRHRSTSRAPLHQQQTIHLCMKRYKSVRTYLCNKFKWTEECATIK